MLNNYTSANGSNGASSLKHKTVTIEFVGLPGAGKSTSCNYFSHLFKARGLNICEIHDIKEYLRQNPLSGKLFLVSKLLLFRSSRVILYIISLLSRKIYSADSIYRYIRLTIFDLALQQLKKNRKFDVVLLDQWIIQEMWSATIFRTKKYSTISKTFSRFYFSTDVVLYFDIDIYTASERINIRPTNLSRFDRMDERKRITELQKYNSYLFELFENSNCKQKHLLSGTNSLEKNAALFVEVLDANFQLN
jgi:thymidylate kinase